MNIYLDNAATTRMSDAAVDASLRAMTEFYGNPSSAHAMGRASKRLLNEARSAIADTLGAEPSEIFFTSGGTESNNWAVFSACRYMSRKGKHIVSTSIEHDSLRSSFAELSRQGFEIELLNPDHNGSIPLSCFESAIREDTVFVSVMSVNNETGNVYDIEGIRKVIKQKKSPALLHTDAVQAYLKLPLSVKSTRADFITVSAHKIHGPKGCGVLYIKKNIPLPPLLHGGGQENGLRSGTESLPAVMAFAAAASEGFNALTKNSQKLCSLKELCITLLKQRIPDITFLGLSGAPHILSISLPGYKSEVILNYLDAKGVYVSKGSACKKGRRSHVLEAMGLSAPLIDSAIRVSFSIYNTENDIAVFAETLCSAKKDILPLRR